MNPWEQNSVKFAFENGVCKMIAIYSGINVLNTL